jgi:radical SAM superfamily enzyme YgiQ (UPF0313 family)
MAATVSPHHRLRRRLLSETSLVPFNPGGDLRVILAYPNTYAVAMGNLGFQMVYRLLNAHPRVSCERAFLPDPDEIPGARRGGPPLLSLETQRPIADSDLIAFSASFENDYPNLLAMLDLAGLPLRSADRDERHPLVLMGGATVSINPEPVADFLDICCVGEGEELVAPLLDVLLDHPPRGRLLEDLSTQPGFYVPSLYRPEYDDPPVLAEPGDERTFDNREVRGPSLPRFAGISALPPAAPTVPKVRAPFSGVDGVAATSILAPDTEFGDRAMIEVARGCTKGCRYCWVGYNVSPFRVHAVDDIMEVAGRWQRHTDRVGLVATALLDHPEIETIAESLRSRSFKVFSPSLIISTLREPLLRAVAESGQRSVTIAPETGSDRLRELIMKQVSNAEILDKTRMIFRAGILNLKCYVIVGLPDEEEEDLEELARLAAEMQAIMVQERKSTGSLGTITLSINCLIPKPGTPFQWAQQVRPRQYRAKLRWLHKRISGIPNVSLESMPPRLAEMQGLLSRGDRRVSTLLEYLHRLGSWGEAIRLWEDEGGSLDHFVYRPYSLADPLPWGHLGTSASRPALRHQWEKARAPAPGAAR